MNWIPVSNPPNCPIKEEYGDLSQNVLIFCKWSNGKDEWSLYTVGYYQINDDGSSEWCTSCSLNWDITETATHWMPLPEAP